MKTILCYGDSNTWGMIPGDGSRFPRDVRWPGVMRQSLGNGFEVIEEGLPGRSTAFDDPFGVARNGKPYLLPCLESHQPLDLVVIMLGTNDVQERFAVSAEQIAAGMESLAAIARAFAPVLIVAPPVVAPMTDVTGAIWTDTLRKSETLPILYKQVAERHGCLFLDASRMVASSRIDGVHLDADQHLTLGHAVAEVVKGAVA